MRRYEEICKYVYMYIACTIVYNIKKKTTTTKKKKTYGTYACTIMYIISKKNNNKKNKLMGLNSTLSSYSQIRSEKKRGGGNFGRLPDYWLVLAVLDLWGVI